jgi:hypothetical protein
MRNFALLLSLMTLAAFVGACGDYANSVSSDVGTPSANGPNPQNLPNPNTVPKPTPPSSYGITLSPVVIQEVLVDPAGPNTGSQYVELLNATSMAADIGGWMLTDGFSSHTFPYGFTVAAGARVVIHVGSSGTDTGAEQFSPSFGELYATGSMALLQGGIDLVDFVEWGAINQNYEATAAQLAEWTAGDFVTPPAEGLSFHYDGISNTSASWQGANPTPGQ